MGDFCNMPRAIQLVCLSDTNLEIHNRTGRYFLVKINIRISSGTAWKCPSHIFLPYNMTLNPQIEVNIYKQETCPPNAARSNRSHDNK